MRTRIRTVAAAAIVLVGVTAGSATAGALVTGAQIKDGSVRGADVRNGSLTGGDVRDGSLSLPDVENLPVGPKGEAGPPGLPGANGVPGLVQRSEPRTLGAGDRLSWTISCDLHETAVSGGVSSTRPDLVSIERSTVDGAHWLVSVVNEGGAEALVFGWAMCVQA
ncbi:hypothetical protein [Nocardioides bizhenqiangii]|uniref:Collagen-like protein n=1 Tax=Nocardioides bizhenqiangii TaxID=3095076 RepID=A0ABZ0ZSQ6_9ACTN|nr:hypothetical protein [Nocardioides sp. HM61]WQQ26528.1 hypothetical protein SHK19_21560 [Nocardioides sp. HM61]